MAIGISLGDFRSFNCHFSSPRASHTPQQTKALLVSFRGIGRHIDETNVVAAPAHALKKILPAADPRVEPLVGRIDAEQTSGGPPLEIWDACATA